MKKSRQGDDQVFVVETMNMDDLAISTDDALFVRLHQLESSLSKMRRFGMSTVDTEVELAYTLREVGIRESRRREHERFTQEMYVHGASSFNEDFYDSGDFDNSEYVRLHNMWRGRNGKAVV